MPLNTVSKRTLLGVLMLLLAMGCDTETDTWSGGQATLSSDSTGRVIPFRGNGAIIVPVHVNGVGPMNFALDTGSTMTCVDEGVAVRLRLPMQESVRGVAAGAAGVGERRVVRVDSLRVGGASMRELPACVLELVHARHVGVEIDGLLGLNFLRAFQVGIDFDRREVRLGE